MGMSQHSYPHHYDSSLYPSSPLLNLLLLPSLLFHSLLLSRLFFPHFFPSPNSLLFLPVEFLLPLTSLLFLSFPALPSFPLPSPHISPPISSPHISPQISPHVSSPHISSHVSSPHISSHVSSPHILLCPVAQYCSAAAAKRNCKRRKNTSEVRMYAQFKLFFSIILVTLSRFPLIPSYIPLFFLFLLYRTFSFSTSSLLIFSNLILYIPA